METLVPYSLYVCQEHSRLLRIMAKDRKASPFLRDAIEEKLAGTKAFDSGYNKALKDACELINESQANILLIGEKRLNDLLTDQMKALVKHGK